VRQIGEKDIGVGEEGNEPTKKKQGEKRPRRKKKDKEKK